MAREDPLPSDDERAKRLGSKAEARAATSSLYKEARSLYTLLVRVGLHKLRLWCPTKQMLAQLFHHARSIEEYVQKDCPDEVNRWRDDGSSSVVDTYPSLEWYVGPQFD